MAKSRQDAGTMPSTWRKKAMVYREGEVLSWLISYQGNQKLDEEKQHRQF